MNGKFKTKGLFNKALNKVKSVKFNKERMLSNAMTVAMVMFMFNPALAGETAIGSAATDIKTKYFPMVKNLLMAIGGLVGLIGGIRIYNKWQNGDQDINKEILGWGGAAIFLVLVPTFVQAFFFN